jgi:hypothetical protein
MILRHATTTARYAAIQEQGLLVRKADPQAKIKGCWLHSASNSPWACLHTLRKHGARLEDVVVVEVDVPRSWLKRFRSGLWYTTQDIPASRLTGRTWPGATFGASASE